MRVVVTTPRQGTVPEIQRADARHVAGIRPLDDAFEEGATPSDVHFASASISRSRASTSSRKLGLAHSARLAGVAPNSRSHSRSCRESRAFTSSRCRTWPLVLDAPVRQRPVYRFERGEERTDLLRYEHVERLRVRNLQHETRRMADRIADCHSVSLPGASDLGPCFANALQATRS